jgi:transposase
LLTGCGHNCVVVAPSLIPMKAGDRVKTDRRDAMMLAKLHRAGELTPIWIPDAAHEAMRDLVRARATAVRVLSKARQHLQGFLLRHDRIYRGARAWTLVYRRWRRFWSATGSHLLPQNRMLAGLAGDIDSLARREVSHEGPNFRLSAVHMSEPSPQRTPVLYQAGGSPRGRAFAAQHAECVFVSGLPKRNRWSGSAR